MSFIKDCYIIDRLVRVSSRAGFWDKCQYCGDTDHCIFAGDLDMFEEIQRFGAGGQKGAEKLSKQASEKHLSD